MAGYCCHPVIEPPQVLINVCINPSLSLEVRRGRWTVGGWRDERRGVLVDSGVVEWSSW